MERANAITPTAIGDISVILADLTTTPDLPPADQKQARYEVQIFYDDGSIKAVGGDLKPHLSGAQQTMIAQFLDEVRALAVTIILAEE